MSDADYDGWDDDNECWNCGGEGRVNDCIDGCCVDQDNIYCPYCSKRCDVCNPPTKKQRGTPLTGKQQAMRTAPWKDFRCEGCKREFTRRAFDRPKHCFNCEWLMSDACKLGDPRLAFAATSVQCAVPLQRQHSKDTP